MSLYLTLGRSLTFLILNSGSILPEFALQRLKAFFSNAIILSGR